jgi:Ice-binding-like
MIPRTGDCAICGFHNNETWCRYRSGAGHPPMVLRHRRGYRSRRRQLMLRSVSSIRPLVLATLVLLASASAAQAAPPPVLLGTADAFAILGGSAITNTGGSVINGDLGLSPGTAVSGFPPGTVNGSSHITDAIAAQAKTNLVTAYQNAAGRPPSGAAPPDVGGRRLIAGVYKTGSVPSLGLTGNLTLDAQGDPRAVFIFQVQSTLVTATDSSVSLINGAQACNVFWQVGTSTTLGTRTAFKGTVMAMASISVNNGVNVQGRLLARTGAVTLINDTVSRSGCAPGTEPGSGTGPGGGGPGTTPGPDSSGPQVTVGGLPGVRQPRTPSSGSGPPRFASVCTTRDFTARIRLRDPSGIQTVSVYIDGKLIKRTTRPRFSVRIKVRGLRIGRHRMTVIARDRAGNRSVKRKSFGRCAIALAIPRFTG